MGIVGIGLLVSYSRNIRDEGGGGAALCARVRRRRQSREPDLLCIRAPMLLLQLDREIRGSNAGQILQEIVDPPSVNRFRLCPDGPFAPVVRARKRMNSGGKCS